MAKSSEKVQELPFPLGGIDEYQAIAHGKLFGTRDRAPVTQSALNVRGVDPRSGRARGGTRSGLSKYVSSQINSSNPIQDINHIVTNDVVPSTGVGQFVYGRSAGSFGLGTAAGVSYFTGGTASAVLESSCWDQNGNAYAADRVTASGSTKVYKVTSAGSVVWTSTSLPALATGANRKVNGMVVIGANLYVAVQVGVGDHRIYRLKTSDGTLADVGAWKTADSISSLTFGANSFNCMAAIDVYLGVHLAVASGSKAFRIYNTTDGSLVNYVEFSQDDTSWLNPVVSDNSQYFYTTTNNSHVFKISYGGNVDWEVTASVNFLKGITFDPSGARLVSLYGGHTPVVVTFSAAAGTETNFANIGGKNTWSSIGTDGQGNFVIFDDSVASNDIAGLSSSLTAAWGPSTFSNTVHRGSSVNMGVLNTLSLTLGTRRIRQLAVAGGTVVRVESTGPVSLTNGPLALSTTAPVVFSAQNGLNLFYADGSVYKYYSSALDQIKAWTPTAGSLPVDSYGNKARLIETYRGRIVLSGLPRDNANWFMSKVNDPFNWDYSPATPNATQAVAGNLSDAGQIGDVVNTLIPHNDDLLLFGCDHTIWQMTGDPADGGRIDLITDTIGMAWGRPWTKAPDGTVYFMGSRGGVFSMTPGSMPTKITNQSIDERLAVIDYSTTMIRMAWDDRQQGLLVFISPLTSATATYNLWYDSRNGAWWIDQFANTNHNPLAVHIYDGDDPDDRVVLIGGRDGYIRKLDTSVTNDDGTAIASYVFLGPLTNAMIKELQCTLATGSGNVTWGTFTAENAQSAIAATVGSSGTFVAGRNRSQWPRRYGQSAYIKLSATSGAWALEQLICRYELGTLTRARIY